MNCLTAICHPINTAALRQWSIIADMTQVLAPPQQLQNVGIAGGEIVADDIVLPDTDVRLIGAVVLHEHGGPTAPLLFISTTPVVRQVGTDAVICVTGFSLDTQPPDPPAEEELVIRKGMSVCERYEILECCLDRLNCGQQKVEVWFDGRRVQYQSIDLKGLERRVEVLRSQCETMRGCTSTRRRRGDFVCV